LAANLAPAIADTPDAVGFRIQRRDFFMGQWLKHVQTTPLYLRLFRPDCMHYERLINSVLVPSGPTGDVAGYIDHFPFSKGLGHWLARHNHYSTLEARQIVVGRGDALPLRPWKAFLTRDFNERRIHQKELFYRAPLRPLAKFLLLYVAKRGFLDGRAGFTYAILQSIYEYMIVLKTRELRHAVVEPPRSAIRST
jgi:hypothetical protein